MTVSMYQTSVPVFTQMLESLSAMLDKAVAHAEAKKFDPSVLINSRLSPDMLPLSFQIQAATDQAKGSVERLSGVTGPTFAGKESTFPELKERVTKTLEFIKSVKPAQIDGSEGRAIHMKLGPNEVNFKGQPYLLHFVLPNFFFHVTTAYALLRHNGVDLGKRDFIGKLVTE